MGKEFRDGLTMEKSFLMVDEKKHGFGIGARMIQIVAIILGSWCFISILRECLAAPVNMLHIDIAIVITVGIMVILCLIPSYDLVKQFFVILFYGLFFYSRLPKLANGFYIIENLALIRMYNYYSYQSLMYQADYSKQVQDTTLLFIMIMIPMAALLTIAVVRSRFIGICSMIFFLPIALCFLVGLIPSEKYLIAYIAIELYLLRSGFSFRNVADKEQYDLFHRINSKAAVWLSLIGLIIFFTLKLFISKNEYDNISEINNMKTTIQTSYLDFTLGDISDWFNQFKLFEGGYSAGGLDGGKLDNDASIEFTNSEQLLLTVPYISPARGIYLKGYVGSDYTGESWNGHSKKDEEKYDALLENLSSEEFVPINQSYLHLNRALELLTYQPGIYSTQIPYEICYGKCEVEYKDANQKFIYTPYFTDYELLDQVYDKQDLYVVPNKKLGEYECNFIFNLPNDYLELLDIDLGASISLQYPSAIVNESEMRYRDYVHHVYTRLPKEGLERLKKDFSADNLLTGEINEIEYVQNYLQENTEYTLSPGKLPKGKDYVEYFLYENKKGYCAHYASAATLMLRAMGVPARYVEGYAVGADQITQNQPEEQQEVSVYTQNITSEQSMNMIQISVRDYNAHAWVEVYIDNFGWIPVDFTPGSAIAFNSSRMSDLTMDKDSNEIGPTPIPITPTPIVMNNSNQTLDNSALTKEADKKDNLILYKTLFAAFVVLTIIAGTFALLKIRKRKILKGSRNRNRIVLFLYVEIGKIFSFGPGLLGKGIQLEDCEKYIKESCEYVDPDVFDACMQTIRKARFGKERITLEELKKVEKFYSDLYDRVYRKLPFFKKVFFKLIF